MTIKLITNKHFPSNWGRILHASNILKDKWHNMHIYQNGNNNFPEWDFKIYKTKIWKNRYIDINGKVPSKFRRTDGRTDADDTHITPYYYYPLAGYIVTPPCVHASVCPCVSDHVSMIAFFPFIWSISNLVQWFDITWGWTLLQFKVIGQRSWRLKSVIVCRHDGATAFRPFHIKPGAVISYRKGMNRIEIQGQWSKVKAILNETWHCF